jgi:hypothetical protein
MSILRSGAAILAMLTLGTALPAAAQYYPRTGVYRSTSPNVVIGNQVQVGAPRSVYVNGQGYYSPYPQVIIIQQQQPYYNPQPTNNCTTTVVGSPIPSPYARDSVTGAICR